MEYTRASQIKNCGDIEETFDDVVAKIVRNEDGDVEIRLKSGGIEIVSPEKYLGACEDYNMTRMTKGSKVRVYHGNRDCAVLINN